MRESDLPLPLPGPVCLCVLDALKALWSQCGRLWHPAHAGQRPCFGARFGLGPRRWSFGATAPLPTVHACTCSRCVSMLSRTVGDPACGVIFIAAQGLRPLLSPPQRHPLHQLKIALLPALPLRLCLRRRAIRSMGGSGGPGGGGASRPSPRGRKTAEMTGLTEERLWSLRVGLVDSGHAARRSRTQMRCTSTVPCGQLGARALRKCRGRGVPDDWRQRPVYIAR